MAVQIKDITKYTFYPLMRARVCRVWISKYDKQVSSFNCLFIDNQGGAIQGSSKARDVAHFTDAIVDGLYYEIRGFYTYENRSTNTVVDNDVVVELKPSVNIKTIDSIAPAVPRYYFNFVDFAHVLSLRKGSKVLTDVLGRLKAIQPLEQVLVRGQTLENKREFILENIRGDEMRITLWSDHARDFDDSVLQTVKSPIIIAFAGFRVTEFRGQPNLNGTAASLWYINPDIPEVLPYHHHFTKLPVEVYKLPSSSNAILKLEDQINENRKTIREILCMNPYEHKNIRFTCRASIADFDIFNGWWYPSCPHCNKKLGGSANNPVCMDHDAITTLPVPWFRLDCVVTDQMDVTNFLMVGKVAENFFGSSAHHYVYDRGFSDPSTIAPPMATKLNKTYIFQLRFGAFRSTTNRCDIVVTNVFDDVPIEHANIEEKQLSHTSNVDKSIHMSVAMSSNVHTALSDPLTPANSAQKISFPTTPLTISPAGTQLVQSIALVAGAKRKLDFNPDDSQQSDSHLDKSLEKDIQAQASQPTDDLSEKQKTSAPIKKKKH